MTAPVLALRAVGLLAEFQDAGLLRAADVHVAVRLGALAGEADEQVLLAAALTVRGTRHGSVVLDLSDAAATITADAESEGLAGDDAVAAQTAAAPGPLPDLPWPDPDEWVRRCAGSPLLVGGPGRPLRMLGPRLWLTRYWQQEAQVADDLLRRSGDRPDDIDPDVLRADLDALFDAGDTDDDADQRHATAVAALSRVSVIGGGPGTGKTTTVARVITVLVRRLGPDVRIALAAPTAKAAARLVEAVHAAAEHDDRLTDADRVALRALSASTLHRLLGWRPDSTSRFRHNRDNRLPYDVVIIDESSMVSLTHMARLLEALAPRTRLVLVGDPDQLASVEAGAVLGDLVDPDDVGPVTAGFGAQLAAAGSPAARTTRTSGPGSALRESVTLLRTVRRFAAGGPIAELAAHVRAGRADAALDLLRSGGPGIEFAEVDDEAPIPAAVLSAVQADVRVHERAMIDLARAGYAGDALDALDAHRLLCAHRGGPRGVRAWTFAAQRRLATEPDIVARADGHYAGQPLLVQSNDYEVGLFNSDTGVVIQRGDDLVAVFRRGATPIEVPLARLGDVRALHAMTVHRAQGSQFERVTVLLPPATSPLATRQTFYTAITRATESVRLVGSADAVRGCVLRPAARATGLRARLAADRG